MPLINCPDCGKEVSDQAESCNNCGRPIAKRSDSLDVEQDAKANKKGNQSAYLRYSLGHAITLLGVIVGLPVGMAAGALYGFAIFVVALALGIIVQYS
jgi:uncharacterized membrane protein YvbJ